MQVSVFRAISGQYCLFLTSRDPKMHSKDWFDPQATRLGRALAALKRARADIAVEIAKESAFGAHPHPLTESLQEEGSLMDSELPDSARTDTPPS